MIGTFLVRFGDYGIPTMGVCVLVGTVLAVFVSWLMRKKSALDWNNEFVDAIIFAVLLGFVGMKILYWIVTPEVFQTAFSDGIIRGILGLLMEGMVFYGGLIGGIIGIILVARKKKKSFFEFSDLMAPCFCIAHAFGRIGCLLVGCCYGVAKGEPMLFGAATYQGALAVWYPDLPNNEGAGPAWRLPVPLMEAVFLLLLCAALLLVYRRTKRLGLVSGLYLILYALWRFAIEGFRGDVVRKIYWIFSTSQWISFGILVAGIVFLILSFKLRRGEPFKEFREAELVVPEAEPIEEPEKPAEEAAETVGAAAEEAGDTVKDAADTADEAVRDAADEAAGEETAETDAGDAGDAGGDAE